MNYKELIMKHWKVLSGITAASVLVVFIGGLLMSSHSRKDEIFMPSPHSETTYASDSGGMNGAGGEYDYKEAPKHIGEQATISGKVLKVYTAKSGVTFLDFCQSFSNCPFSAVIFASALKQFGDLKKYERDVKITGMVKSYQGRAEIIVDSPEQIK
jgi:hypothetical protein